MDFFAKVQTEEKRGNELADRLKGNNLKVRTDYCEQLKESTEIAAIKWHLIVFAEDTHKEYTQYANYWNTWKLGRVKKDLMGKHGIVHALKGDYVLVSPKASLSELQGGTKFCGTMFTPRCFGGNCSFDVEDIEII